jgi:hypothetical protein
MVRRLLLAACAASAPLAAARAQFRQVPVLRLASADSGAIAARRPSEDSARVPWYAPLASLAVPGLGQVILGDDRALAYFAVEAYALIEYRAQRTEGRRGQTRYREIAHDVARAFFSDTRPVGQFEYYEAMRKYVESGAFDRVPGGDVDPEVDETTYNGSIWRLARDTYWSDPDIPPPSDSEPYRAAVSLYLQRAIVPEYRWSWRNAALEHDLYRTAIDRSNRAFRRARTQFGILLANHLLSMTDAFATVRVRYPSASNGDAWALEVALPWPTRW